MATLYETIRLLVKNDADVIGEHAAERLEARGILEWQAVCGICDGKLIEERPNALPNPAIEVELVIPPDDSNEACYESETIRHLREVQERAEKKDIDWLVKHGKVYTSLQHA